MITQTEADRFLELPKILVEKAAIQFPMPASDLQREARSEDGRDFFLFDVNRKGKIKISKCTYQNRYAVVEVLLRLDIDGPPHENPDGELLPCPHLHIYREGFGTKWAIAAPPEFTDTSDLVKTFIHFLRYAKVANIPNIQRRIE